MLRKHFLRQSLFSFAMLQLIPAVGLAANTITPQIRLAEDHFVILKTDGSVWQSGAIAYGRTQATNGACLLSFQRETAPIPVSGLGPVIAIAVAGQQSIALKSDGTVWAWGRDPEMALNLGCIALSNRHTVWQIRDAADGSGFLQRVSAIWGSSGSFFARKADGSVVAWGRNEMNKLGTNPPALAKSASKPPPEVENIASPLLVTQLQKTVAGIWPPTIPESINSGGTHSLAILPDRSVWAWGGAQYGERGDGSYGYSPYWSGFSWRDHYSASAIDSVIATTAGLYTSLAVKSDGSVWVWGCNEAGELGNAVPLGTHATCAHVPVQVSGLSGAVAIATASHHSLILHADGTVSAMGNNGWGELGNDPAITVRSTTPLKVSNLGNVTAIDAAGTCSVALRNDGSVVEWGDCPDASHSWQIHAISTGTAMTEASCGSANGKSMVSAPPDNLCLIGTASQLIGSGPWAWTCTRGGSVKNCAATNGPVFVLDPAGGRYFPGRAFTLRSLAQSTGTLSYQWYKKVGRRDIKLANRRGINTPLGGNSSISGSTTPQLVISGLTAADGGMYYLEARDQNAIAAQSQNAEIVVMSPTRPTSPALQRP